MALKKAPKKAAKKAAKKAPAKQDPHKPERDARRAFEHLGRIEAVSNLTFTEHDALGLLVTTAKHAFESQYYREAADLLRAAEHLSFATMARSDAAEPPRKLVLVIQDEFDHLIARAEEHGNAANAPAAIARLFARMTKEAGAAFRRKEYRKALELARGAESLTHLGSLDENLLRDGGTLKSLRA